ncbi:CPCC family cysteine-rich protein [Algoriella sp.]|uniref:CPCC family cysteine-rich protein n=1 Tax=Algoriella sp. TaxID=1872434 RepID=UPI002FCAAE8F
MLATILMKHRMDRSEAKEIVATNELKNLSNERKIQILEENYWWFNEKVAIKESIEEGSYPKIPDSFIEFIHKTPNPILTKETEILLIDFLKFKLKYTTNLYLKTQLDIINPNIQNNVIGEVEIAGLCPCCEYYSIDYGEDGFWDICSVCFWENGGDGPNHMTLENAKSNFLEFGAIDKESLNYVDKEAKRKYKKKL